MSDFSLAGTEYAAANRKVVRRVSLEADGHHRVLFHTANLTSAIDVAAYRAVSDGDGRSAVTVYQAIAIGTYHGCSALECAFAAVFGFTLAAAEYVTGNRGCVAGIGGWVANRILIGVIPRPYSWRLDVVGVSGTSQSRIVCIGLVGR